MITKQNKFIPSFYNTPELIKTYYFKWTKPIREMQIKTEQRYHKTPNKVAKNNADHTSVNEDKEPQELPPPWWKCPTVKAQWDTA